MEKPEAAKARVSLRWILHHRSLILLLVFSCVVMLWGVWFPLRLRNLVEFVLLLAAVLGVSIVGLGVYTIAVAARLRRLTLTGRALVVALALFATNSVVLSAPFVAGYLAEDNLLDSLEPDEREALVFLRRCGPMKGEIVPTPEAVRGLKRLVGEQLFDRIVGEKLVLDDAGGVDICRDTLIIDVAIQWGVYRTEWGADDGLWQFATESGFEIYLTALVPEARGPLGRRLTTRASYRGVIPQNAALTWAVVTPLLVLVAAATSTSAVGVASFATMLVATLLLVLVPESRIEPGFSAHVSLTIWFAVGVAAFVETRRWGRRFHADVLLAMHLLVSITVGLLVLLARLGLPLDFDDYVKAVVGGAMLCLVEMLAAFHWLRRRRAMPMRPGPVVRKPRGIDGVASRWGRRMPRLAPFALMRGLVSVTVVYVFSVGAVQLFQVQRTSVPNPDTWTLVGGTLAFLGCTVWLWRAFKWPPSSAVVRPSSLGYALTSLLLLAFMMAPFVAGLGVDRKNEAFVEAVEADLRAQRRRILPDVAEDASFAAVVSGDLVVRASGPEGALVLRDLNDPSRRDVLLGEHGAWVFGIARGGDGVVVTGGRDGVLKRWNLAGQPSDAQILGHHGSAVTTMCSRGDGSFVSAGEDGTVRFWNNGTESSHDTHHAEVDVLICLRGTRADVVSVGRDRTIVRWSPETDNEPVEVGMAPFGVVAGTEVAQGQVVLSSWAGTIWKMSDGAKPRSTPEVTFRARDVVGLRDGGVLVVGEQTGGGAVYAFGPMSDDEAPTVRHLGGVGASVRVAIAHDTGVVTVASHGRVKHPALFDPVFVWDRVRTQGGTIVGDLRLDDHYEDVVVKVAAQVEGENSAWVLVDGADRLQMVDEDNPFGVELRSVRGLGGVRDLFSFQRKTVFLLDWQQNVWSWSARGGKLRERAHLRSSFVSGGGIAPLGRTGSAIVVAGQHAYLVGRKNLTKLEVPDNFPSEVKDVVALDGRQIAIATRAAVEIWECSRGGDEDGAGPCQGGTLVQSAVANEPMTRLAAAGSDVVWGAHGRAVYRWDDFEGAVDRVGLMPSSVSAIAATSDRGVVTASKSSGAIVDWNDDGATLIGVHGADVASLAETDAGHVVSVGHDGVLREWSRDDGQSWEPKRCDFGVANSCRKFPGDKEDRLFEREFVAATSEEPAHAPSIDELLLARWRLHPDAWETATNLRPWLDDWKRDIYSQVGLSSMAGLVQCGSSDECPSIFTAGGDSDDGHPSRGKSPEHDAQVDRYREDVIDESRKGNIERLAEHAGCKHPALLARYESNVPTCGVGPMYLYRSRFVRAVSGTLVLILGMAVFISRVRAISAVELWWAAATAIVVSMPPFALNDPWRLVWVGIASFAAASVLAVAGRRQGLGRVERVVVFTALLILPWGLYVALVDVFEVSGLDNTTSWLGGLGLTVFAAMVALRVFERPLWAKLSLPVRFG